MKNLILTIAVALAAITGSFANNNDGGIKYPHSAEMVMEPENISTPVTIETLERTIAEDSKIIESDTVPAVEAAGMDRILYTIGQDRKITESQNEDTVYPLDFRKINKKTVVLKLKSQKPVLVGSL